jgi:hypothetical protein
MMGSSVPDGISDKNRRSPFAVGMSAYCVAVNADKPPRMLDTRNKSSFWVLQLYRSQYRRQKGHQIYRHAVEAHNYLLHTLSILMSTQSYFTELVGRLHILELKTLAGSLLLAVLGTVVYRVLFHPLTGIPGPRIAAVTGLWRSYRYAQGTWHDDILKVHKKYGRVVRIAPDEVSVVDASVVKQLFSHGTSALKTKWYNTWMVAPGHNLFAEQEPKLHSALRKRVTAAYSMSSILKFEEYIQGCLDLCFVKFKSYAEQEKAVDLAEWTNALAFDIVGELGYGQQLGHLRTESDVNGLRKTIHDAFKMVSTLGHFPGQSSLVINPYLGAFLRAFGVVNAFEEFEAWCMIRVNARRIGSDGAERADLLSHFLAMKDLDGQNPATVKDILTESGTLM